MPNKFVQIKEAFLNQAPTPCFITESLCIYADHYVESLRYQLALPLLMAYGKRYKARPYVYPVHGQLTDRCYDSAYALALHDANDLYYCEGFLCYKETERVLAHGWCMTKAGRIVDPTLYAHQHEDGLTYYGFPIKMGYAKEWHDKYGYMGLLDGHKDGLPVGVHYDPAELWLERVSWRDDE